jgi:hypothetical protein
VEEAEEEEEAVENLEMWRTILTLGREGEPKGGGGSLRQRQTADGPGKGELGDVERGKRGKGEQQESTKYLCGGGLEET